MIVPVPYIVTTSKDDPQPKTTSVITCEPSLPSHLQQYIDSTKDLTFGKGLCPNVFSPWLPNIPIRKDKTFNYDV